MKGGTVSMLESACVRAWVCVRVWSVEENQERDTVQAI